MRLINLAQANFGRQLNGRMPPRCIESSLSNHSLTKSTVITSTNMRALIFSLLIIAPHTLLSQSIDHYRAIIDSYRTDYRNNSVSTEDLLGYFHSAVAQAHIDQLNNGKRFVDPVLQWALNAPIELEVIENTEIVDCKHLSDEYQCVEIIGHDSTPDSKKVTKVVLGFINEDNRNKISGVYVERGGPADFYTFDQSELATRPSN